MRLDVDDGLVTCIRLLRETDSPFIGILMLDPG